MCLSQPYVRKPTRVNHSMTTRSGANYNSMGDPASNPSSSNPVNPSSDIARLESALQSFAMDIKAQVAEIKENLNETRAMTNRRLNELEHPELSLRRDRRSTPHEGRPSTAQGLRATPPMVHSPPYQPEYGTPPHYEPRYPPPGYRPYSPEPRPHFPTLRPRPYEFRPRHQERPYPYVREQPLPPHPVREHGHRNIDPNDRILKGVKIKAPSFDGQLDPTRFLDWLADIDHYFEWYDMSDEQRVRFAKIKLMGQA